MSYEKTLAAALAVVLALTIGCGYEGEAPMAAKKMVGCYFYISPEGRDTWSGRLAKPCPDASDGPFATPERARNAIRHLKQDAGLPKGGVTVRISGGNYVLREGLRFTQGDSGTADSPVVWRAVEGERARFLGGRIVSNFKPLEDPAVIERLGEEARRHVVRADLKALGITDFGRLRSRGFARPAEPAHTELFFGGRPMTLARWPNDDFTTITRVGKESAEGDKHGGQLGLLEEGFHYEGDRPRQWKEHKNIWVHGYWAWDWANSFEEVNTIDLETRLIKTRPPFGNYGYKDGQRFYFLNVLEELDGSGEYYVDTEAGVLYFWPPAPLEKNEALVSVLEEPMVSMENVSYVTLRGLTLECTRGHAIVVKDCTGSLIAGCTIRNIGSHGVVVVGGSACGVQSCDISETGDSGIEMTGGDRGTLTPCGHFAHNNHIWHFARWSRCYRLAVHVGGVGVRVTHNLIHDAPHTGILYNGNENLIEFNEIYRVTLETGDCGAIYSGRDFTARGNVIRHNFIHHTSTAGKGGSMAVYLDDCLSGQTVVGNVFHHVTRAAFIGGGRDNIVENNVFVDCEPAVLIDGRGVDKKEVWHNMIYKTMKDRLDAVKHREPPYSERYPELLQLDAYYERDDGVPPEGNVIARNICVGGTWMNVGWGAEERHLTIKDNLVDEDPRFVDAANGDFRLQKDSPAWRIGFQEIPFHEIGLRKDDYRTAVTKALTRLDLLSEAADESGNRATLRLVVRNAGDLAVAGTVRLAARPAFAAGFPKGDSIPFSLLPGASASAEVEMLTLANSFDVEAFSDTPGVRPSRLAFRTAHWPVRRLRSLRGPDAVAEALDRSVRRRVFWRDLELAEVSIAVAGQDLALSARVRDTAPVRPADADFWKGSHVEVFAVMPGSDEIGQVVFLPPSNAIGAKAWVARKGRQLGPSNARWKVTPREDGYRLLALIPLDELALEEAADSFLIEIAAGIAPSESEGLRYATLFGSRVAWQDAARFCPLTVPPHPSD